MILAGSASDGKAVIQEESKGGAFKNAMSTLVKQLKVNHHSVSLAIIDQVAAFLFCFKPPLAEDLPRITLFYLLALTRKASLQAMRRAEDYRKNLSTEPFPLPLNFHKKRGHYKDICLALKGLLVARSIEIDDMGRYQEKQRALQSALEVICARRSRALHLIFPSLEMLARAESCKGVPVPECLHLESSLIKREPLISAPSRASRRRAAWGP